MPADNFAFRCHIYDTYDNSPGIGCSHPFHQIYGYCTSCGAPKIPHHFVDGLCACGATNTPVTDPEVPEVTEPTITEPLPEITEPVVPEIPMDATPDPPTTPATPDVPVAPVQPEATIVPVQAATSGSNPMVMVFIILGLGALVTAGVIIVRKKKA